MNKREQIPASHIQGPNETQKVPSPSTPCDAIKLHTRTPHIPDSIFENHGEEEAKRLNILIQEN